MLVYSRPISKHLPHLRIKCENQIEESNRCLNQAINIDSMVDKYGFGKFTL
jgi:hypothetical protein